MEVVICIQVGFGAANLLDSVGDTKLDTSFVKELLMLGVSIARITVTAKTRESAIEEREL